MRKAPGREEDVAKEQQLCPPQPEADENLV